MEIIIRFTKLPEGIASFAGNVISVDADAFNAMNLHDRHFILSHEMGHWVHRNPQPVTPQAKGQQNMIAEKLITDALRAMELSNTPKEIIVVFLTMYIRYSKQWNALRALAVACRNEGMHSIVDEVEKDLDCTIVEEK